MISREDVFRVRYANIRRRHTLIGMAVGAVVGAVMVKRELSGGSGSQQTNTTLIGAAFGVAGGAAVGGALPIGKPLYEVSGGLKK